MVRILSQTLTLIHDPLPFLSPRLITGFRPRSKLPENPDIESDPSRSGSEVELVGVRRLEEAIHSIVARKLAPDWIVFVPGSSYWVPPPRRWRSTSVEEVVGRVRKEMMSAEEVIMSLKSSRGWPSSAYFVEGALPYPPVKKKNPGNSASQSDDEES